MSPTEIVVTGGYEVHSSDYYRLQDGYIYNVETNTVKKILGDKNDFEFSSHTQTQWVGHGKFITLGEKDRHAFLVQFLFDRESNEYAEVRAIEDLGHLAKDEVGDYIEKLQVERYFSLMAQMSMLRKVTKDGLTDELKDPNQKANYRKLYYEYE